MDIIDFAQASSEAALAREIASAVAKIHAGQSRYDCIDCEEPIPEARRRAIAGCQRCLACQLELEAETRKTAHVI